MRTENGGATIPDSSLGDVLTQVNQSILDIIGLIAKTVTIDVSGTGDYTVPAADARNRRIVFIGTLTGNRTILWPATESANAFTAINDTTGAFSLTIITDAVGSTGVEVAQGRVRQLEHDGTNVYGVGVEVSSTTGTMLSPAPDFDNFNRADSASSMGNSQRRNRAWSAIGGTWGIQSSQAYLVTSAGTNANAAVLDAGASDVNVRAVVSNVSADFHIVARLTDINNLWIIGNESGTTWRLYKRVAGTFTQVGSYTAAPATNDVVEMMMNGSTLKVLINGVERISVVDTFNQNATKHGLFTNSTAVRYDEFEIL